MKLLTHCAQASKIGILYLIVPFSIYSMEAPHMAINIAGGIDNREYTYIGNFVINNYFRDEMNPHLIIPHLRARMDELWNSDKVDDQGSVMDLRRMVQKVDMSHEQKLRVLSNIIIPSAQEAIKKQNRKAQRRLTKRQSGCIAAATGIVTTVISSGVAIAISSVARSCPGT